MAGYVAFAVARELCRQGEEVAFLAIIDMPVPGYARLSRVAALRSFIGRLHWQMHCAPRATANKDRLGCRKLPRTGLAREISGMATGPRILSSNRPTLASVAASSRAADGASCRQRCDDQLSRSYYSVSCQ